jgi:outer membrane protein
LKSLRKKEKEMIKIMKSRAFLAVFAVCLLLGAWGTAQAAPVATGPVGYVDFLYLVNQHPDTAQANAALKTEQDAVKQEFATKAPGLSDQDKLNLERQLGQRLEQKRLELVKPISAKVVAAANEVASEKGLSIVIGRNEVVCGGLDITADVLKKISGK